MNELSRSLNQITTTYCVFEKDQVLTHMQLNDLAQYFDDQGRLTRVSLLGVGIACGLRVALANDKVRLTRGVGVTTDGDLLQLQVDTSYDRFKNYEQSNVEYPLFRVGGALIKVFELVGEGEKDDAATPLAQFNAKTTLSLEKMTAVLLMESYIKDRDICSGTDCDNLGKDSVNNRKLLLIERASADSLREKIATPADAYTKLNEIAVDRPLLTSAISSPALWAASYRHACDAVLAKLLKELNGLYGVCSAFLGDVFSADPTAAWAKKLNAINDSFANKVDGIQYYYDFLKDLALTYNDFRSLLFGERMVCCPDLTAFPKHLLLGNLEAASATENRTGFYPSPLVRQSSERLEHARFLARKLDVLINTFQIPDGNLEIRVTPSHTEETGLEDRSIPFYYQVNKETNIAGAWNYQRTRRMMQAFNYGYNAAAYGAQGGAVNPLENDIGPFSFFRIEGHLGKQAEKAASDLENQIKVKNLPITIQTALLGVDKTKITRKPPIRYTDLHRFHYLLRQDVVHQLDDAVNFSENLKGQVKSAVDTQGVDDTSAESPRPDMKELADKKQDAVATPATRATAKLNRKFSEFRADASWKEDVRETLTAAGDFKLSLTKVAKTDFVTPLDSLIASTHMRWVDMLEGILKDKEDKADEKLFFGAFLMQNPGAEHFAGAARGGTFVLLYDEKGIIVGDCALPYHWREPAEEEPAEVPLPKPDLRPPFILNKGLSVVQPLDKILRTRLDVFKTQIEPDWQKKLDGIKDYVGAFKDSSAVFGRVLDSVGIGKVTIPGGTREKLPVANPKLEELLGNMDQSRIKVEELRSQALDPTLDAAAHAAKDVEIKKAELGLADAITAATKHVAENKLDVNPGTDGFAAISEVSRNAAILKDAEAVNKLKTGLTDAGTAHPVLRGITGRIVR